MNTVYWCRSLYLANASAFFAQLILWKVLVSQDIADLIIIVFVCISSYCSASQVFECSCLLPKTQLHISGKECSVVSSLVSLPTNIVLYSLDYTD